MRFSAIWTLLVGVSIAVPAAAQAQEPHLLPGSTMSMTAGSKLVVFVAPNGDILPSATGADHREEITFRDSVSGTVRVYYASGKVYRIIPYAHLAQHLQHGVETSWYEDGRMLAREEYVSGKRQGERLLYYPTGVLKRRETYVAGNMTAGELFGPDGQVRPYAEEFTAPVYPGGEEKLNNDLNAHLRYPTAALRNNVEGQVFVVFTVAADGQLQNLRILKSSSPLLEQASLTAISRLKLFSPARRDGEPVASEMSLPVNFRITESRLSPMSNLPDPAPMRVGSDPRRPSLDWPVLRP